MKMILKIFIEFTDSKNALSQITHSLPGEYDFFLLFFSKSTVFIQTILQQQVK